MADRRNLCDKLFRLCRLLTQVASNKHQHPVTHIQVQQLEGAAIAHSPTLAISEPAAALSACCASPSRTYMALLAKRRGVEGRDFKYSAVLVKPDHPYRLAPPMVHTERSGALSSSYLQARGPSQCC